MARQTLLPILYLCPVSHQLFPNFGMYRFLPLLLLLASTYGYAQAPAEATDAFRRHSLHVELLGRNLTYGSINYEFALKPQFSVGAGLGVMDFDAGDFIDPTLGDATFIYSETSQSLYANYFLGKRNHKALLTAGATNYLFHYRWTYTSTEDTRTESHLGWNVGLGYQYSKGRFYGRATAYLLYLPREAEFYITYLPYIGFTGGLRL